MATLIGANVALPKDVAWHGKIVHAVFGRHASMRAPLDDANRGDDVPSI